MTSRLGLRLLALACRPPSSCPRRRTPTTLTVEDGAGDAKALNLALVLGQSIDETTPVEEQIFLDAPAETTADVVRTTIDHAEKRLTLTVQFRDLVDTAGHSVEFRIFTPRRQMGPVRRHGRRPCPGRAEPRRGSRRRTAFAAPCGPATTSPPTR